ncbi:MAG: hypothetical protein EZS28_043356 [Streblomastix strix]|uniref:Uncharacterized protein n=1 Tax=Streblomastix strix TaxID=222440 RepID=A0A5J4TS83_9EUKA|nr:MAG: hypothetical protein EZS28_043356 [Streblomastix strix]
MMMKIEMYLEKMMKLMRYLCFLQVKGREQTTKTVGARVDDNFTVVVEVVVAEEEPNFKIVVVIVIMRYLDSEQYIPIAIIAVQHEVTAEDYHTYPIWN